MNTVEKIKILCKQRKIPVSKLESDLGFANGYIGQLKKGDLPFNKAFQVAKYFEIPLSELLEDSETILKLSAIANEMIAEQELLKYFRELNEEGRMAALKQMEFLARQPEYIKNSMAEEIEA